MKNLSLTVKLWMVLSLVLLLFYLVVALIMPHVIRNFLTDNLMGPAVPPPKNQARETHGPRDFYIRNFILLEEGSTLPAEARQGFSESLLAEIRSNAETQRTPKQLYESRTGQVQIRYVIDKNEAYGKPLYQIMFLRKPEEDLYVRNLLFNIMFYVGLALVVSWFASFLIVRYLTRPLTLMEQHVKRIANRNWHEPLSLKQNDELGKLARSIDSMRRQLIQQDEMQQSMLQNVSHELKTPVMVIRSYARAIQDGIYPKGDLAGSIKVIDEEGERLEKLIMQLLYLTRLNYLSAQKTAEDSVQLHGLVEKITQRLYLQRPEISWQLDLQPVTVKGDEDTLRTVVENILDNHLRYAASTLKISLSIERNQNEACLRFWNDGSRVEPQTVNQLFVPFRKGREGKMGLGLTIVHRILRMYRGRVVLENEGNGVVTTVYLPLNDRT